jgi:RNA polymerase sigma factor (sigma-70 family)
MEERNEASLVEESTAGDRKAYAELVRLHAGHVYAMCLAMLHNTADAKDISQETLMRGFTEISSLQNRGRFGPWLMAIAANLCRDHLRRRPNGCEETAEPTDPASGDTERLVDLRRTLHRLPDEYLVPLLMYYYDGRSCDSVAETLGISREAVYMRLSRARRELRCMLEEGEHDHER